MESANIYNIQGGLISVADINRAITDDKVTLEVKLRKVIKEGKEIGNFADFQILVSGIAVRSIVFKNIRFNPLSYYRDPETKEVKKPTGTNTYLLMSTSRKLQVMSYKGFPWKRQGSSDLMDLLDKLSSLIATTLSKRGIVSKGGADGCYRITEKGENSNFEWQYQLKIPSWKEVPDVKLYKPIPINNNLVGKGEQIQLSHNDIIVQELGKDGLMFISGQLRIESGYITSGKKVQGAIVTGIREGIIAFDVTNNVKPEDDISQSVQVEYDINEMFNDISMSQSSYISKPIQEVQEVVKVE